MGQDSAGKDLKRISCNPTVVWEDEFARLVNTEFNAKSMYVTAYVQTAQSLGNELSKVIGGDVVSLNIGLFLIVLYAILVLGKFHPVLSRSALAFSGCVSVGLAIGGAYGIAGWTGVPQTPVTSVLPFLLLGIGVDDMFVLAGSALIEP
jgi:predicted RND superfamily exporter protein